MMKKVSMEIKLKVYGCRRELRLEFKFKLYGFIVLYVFYSYKLSEKRTSIFDLFSREKLGIPLAAILDVDKPITIALALAFLQSLIVENSKVWPVQEKSV